MAEENKDDIFSLKAEDVKVEDTSVEPEDTEDYSPDDYDYEEELVPLSEVEIVDIGYRLPNFKDKYGNVDAAGLKKSYPHLTSAAAEYIDAIAEHPVADAPDANVNDF